VLRLQRAVTIALKDGRRPKYEIPHYPFGLFGAIKSRLRPVRAWLRKRKES
jgi:hypothetical protein